jgi:hypothetical protein
VLEARMVDETAGSAPGHPGDWARELHGLLDGLELRAWHGPDEPGGDEPWMREALQSANDYDAAETKPDPAWQARSRAAHGTSQTLRHRAGAS